MAGNGDKWRWADSEGVQRVVQTDELRAALASGALPPTTLVWRAGMPKWQKASDVAELMAAPKASALRGTIVGIPPPPASVVAAQAAYEQGGFTPPSSVKPSAPPLPPSGTKDPASARSAADETATSSASAASDSKKPGSVVSSRAPSAGEPKKKSVPPAASAGAEPKKKSIPPPAAWATAKKKSVPPPAPPAPAIKATAGQAGGAKPEPGKPAQVPPNAWGAPPATKPSARAAPPAVQNNKVAVPAVQGVDESELETWVAKPAVSPQELAAAALGSSPSANAAGVTPATAVAVAPGVTPPAPVVVVTSSATPATPAAAITAQGVSPVVTRPSAFPLGGLPPTRLSSPLPPPPRRSHPAPATPSTAPQAFAQSSAAQAPFSTRDGLPPPSVPPLQPVANQLEASPNGVAEGDLPAFPLDEIDPDDERPFRPSPGAGAGSTSGAPAAVDAQYDASGGSLRGVLAYIRANPKDPRLLVALGGGAVLVVGLLWAFAAMSGAPSRDQAEIAKPSGSAAEPAPGASVASPTAAANAQESTKSPTATACRLTGTPARVAEKAAKDIPLELLVTSSGERVRMGFATAASAAQGIAVDLNTLQVTPEFSKPPKERLRAVIPFGTEDAPEFVAQLEGHADKLKAWRTLSFDPHVVIGWSGSALGVADKATHAPTTLFPLEGSDPIDVIRAARAEDRGHAVVFRRHGAIYGGMIGPDRAAVGELTRIAGAGAPPGSPVGTPSVAVNGQSVAVAFADRASSDEPWSIRLGTAPLGSFPAVTTPFIVPPGGRGGATLAPALSGLPDGRWLLVWTEGSGGAHDVRGVTLGADLAPVGPPLTVSREGSNAGQGAVALRAGRGLIAYLALTEEGYEVWGTTVDCR